MSFSRGPKFKATRTPDSAGVMHASKGQAAWFDKLRLRQRAGEITELELEPAFPILINGTEVCVVKADARFFDVVEQRCRVVDYKGVEGDTPVSRLKRRLVAAAYGVEIEITGPAKARQETHKRQAAERRELRKRERRAAKAALTNHDNERPPAR